MPKLSKTTRSNVRRFLLDVIKPTPTLGKRAREDDVSEHNSKLRSVAPTRVINSTTPAACTKPACIALQNEDVDEDAVVITALNVVPFCCHADLVTMNRTQLLAVAETLNAKLPLALQIDVGRARSDAFIRNSIELLVGLRQEMPPAPKRTRSHTFCETPRAVPSSPASPLAGRSRSNMSLATPALAMLREEDEGSSRDSDRPQKRRRVAAQPSSPTFILDSRRPITRAQSHRVAPMVTSAESPTASMRVLRTRSQKLPERTPLYPSILSNVTVTRGRSTTRGRDGLFAKRASFATTSTPKKRAMAAVNSPESAAPRFRPVFADIKQAMDGQPRGIACLDDSTDVSEVTFGIDGLTMPLVEQDSSDMDVSSGY